MGILEIVALGIIATITVVLLKETKPEIAALVGLGAGIIIIITVLDSLFEIIYAFYNIAEQTGIDKGIFSSVLKIIGIGYISEFSSNICADAGVKSIGDKISFASKVIIMLLALPIMQSLIKIITEIL